MRIGIPREPDEAQTLVAATPDTVGKLIKLGYDVIVEAGAGEKASFPDHLFEEAGAAIVGTAEAWGADVVFALDTPPLNYLDMMQRGATLIARMAPGRSPETIEALAQRGLTGLAMDMVPRISRAQSMDVLSSMANIAGYRAVVEAAAHFGRLFTGQVTAAGKMPPATVYVIGAGVAGLAAIGTANSMGAIVNATDVRNETAEQVESMGASFVPIPAPAQESSDGYAKEMTADQAQAAEKLYAEQAAKSDVVITTANVPGRKSPLLLSAQAVEAMKPGSIIVDMAAANGGNCELTVPGEVVTTPNGVIIIGYTDLAGRLPAQASQLYGQNLVNFFKLATPEKDGNLTLDLDDEVIEQMAVTILGEVKFPPPPVKVSAAPSGPTKEEQEAAAAAKEAEKARAATVKRRNWAIGGIVAAIVLIALVLATPAGMLQNYIILALSIVVGFYVITAVTHSLHTPLMSETNAISGIILVGAIISMVHSSNIAVTILAFIAVLIASINIFGGFFVTHRMLGMFRKED
ncbi:MAG: Re/Si-specific NAD(P)(+) transhydrogenase subunit alpha [Actinomycetaceae bacterium]|nr:Re/Si-specific NAD(P)(+) transhydrogenase subunit alpha [Arcanobacterium sp.]MDD7505251.1 Re/Si-specific NAD(P)(+) transhydrogenase subunit alpha [Actinomycetaceae bacterium]MDY6144014.1 Re/Si-specific NAD(P)(+) transhydrogenase subunit alpha [Arcanobacterium sp.]